MERGYCDRFELSLVRWIEMGIMRVRAQGGVGTVERLRLSSRGD